MLGYLRSTPTVRDVVVSGGDVANLPWPRVEAFVSALLEIESIRDIRLASKALMGLPQHWLSPDVLSGVTRLAAVARARGVSLAVHTHVNAAQSVTPLVARATRALLDAGVRDVRNQGVLLRGVNDSPGALLDLCFCLLDEAGVTPYYFYQCDMIPGAEHWRLTVREAQAAAVGDHGLPARLRDAAGGVRRAVRGQALGAPGGQVRHGARHLVLDEGLPDGA
jgi:lysine 2,3-aminomutase